MATEAVRMHAPTGVMTEVPAVRATDVKNAMAKVLECMKEEGIVALTNHGNVRAVMLSLETYEGLIKRAGDPLEKLTKQFDRMVASMQGPKARKAADAVFGPLPAKAQQKLRTAR